MSCKDSGLGGKTGVNPAGPWAGWFGLALWFPQSHLPAVPSHPHPASDLGLYQKLRNSSCWDSKLISVSPSISQAWHQGALLGLADSEGLVLLHIQSAALLNGLGGREGGRDV